MRLQDYIDQIELGAWSLSGRYYAMDREHWDRVKRAYDVMTQDDQRWSFVIEVLQDHMQKKSARVRHPNRIAPEQ